MRDNTIETFFALVRAGLFPVHGEGGMVHGQDKRQSRAIESLFRDVDWNEVYQLAQEQSVEGLVSAGLDWFRVHDSRFKVPQTVVLQFVDQTLQIEQQNKEMNAFVADLIEKLRQNDIYALLVKGQGIAQCYEKPLWRCSGDVDLFLDDVNYEKAKRLLMPLASEVETESVGSKHLGMTINDWIVELHGSLRVGLPNKINRVLDYIKTETFNRG